MQVKTLLAPLLAASFLASQPLKAEILVFDFGEFGPNVGKPGAPGGYGFYTGGTFENNAWIFQDDPKGGTFVWDTLAGTATFSAEVVNGLGRTGVLDLQFSGILQSLEGTGLAYWQGRGGPEDPENQVYFTQASGTFDHESFAQPFFVDVNDPLAGNTVVQFGEGAAFYGGDGISAWLQFIDPATGKVQSKWDIAAPLKRGHKYHKHKPTDVPEPGPIVILAFAALATAAMRKRKSKSLPT